MLEKIKDSIKGFLSGLVLLFVSFSALFWNECRAVDRAQDIEEGASNYVSVASDSVNSGNDGKLVHMSGKAETTQTLTDPRFQVSETAIRLERDVEMYQWSESKEEIKDSEGKGTGRYNYDYSKRWSSTRIDSSGFNDRSKVNPPMPYASEEWQATNVTLGAYRLSPKLIGQITDGENVSFTEADLAGLPADIKAKAKIDDGKIYVGAGTSASPSVGDVRVSFKVVLPQDVSIMAKQQGSSFVDFVGSEGSSIHDLRAGIMTGDEFIAKLEEENSTMTWIIRVVGTILMCVAIGLIFKPFSEIADAIPLVGNFLEAGIAIFAIAIGIFISFMTIAIAWIVARPLIGIILLVVAIGAIVGLAVLASKKKKEKAEATPA